MSKIKPQDHPDYVGGWVWTKLELDWINERIGTLEAALFQAQEAAKDLEARLTKTEGWLNEAVWNYGELKREQLANSEETSSSPVEDWEAIAADQDMTIALLRAEQPAQQEPLTDEYIERIYHRYGGDMINCARAIERAAQRTWVGLTDQEIENLWNQHEPRFDYYLFSCDIESKLKEKNNG